ncbi:MAG: carboxymuconolactone decarboxylase family protein [Sphingobium sp.]
MNMIDPETPADRDARVRAREAEILGKPPRIAPVDRASVAEEVQAATNKLRGGVVGDHAPLPLDVIPEIMFVMCRFPVLWDRIMALSLHLQSETGALPVRDRQLAILRTAWLLQAPYEWGEHVRHSKACGLSDEEIERVITGSAASGWTDHERAILTACEELRQDVFVSDATWATLSESFDDTQMVELLVLIGQFTSVAYLQNSLRLRLEAKNVGLTAR